MSYESLADQLRRTADTLAANASRLQGTKLAEAADKVAAALKKLEAALQAALKESDPAVFALRDLLETKDARSALDAPTLKALAKRVSGKALTLKATDTPEDRRRRFLDAMVKLEKAHEATVALRALLEAASRPAPDPSDRERVLDEVWRLAKLGEMELEVERERLLANPQLLRAMALHTYVKVTVKSAPRTIFANLLKFARRVQENTA